MTAVVTVGGASPVRLPRRARTVPADATLARLLAAVALALALVLTCVTVALHLRTGDTPLTSWWYGNAALTLSLTLPAYLLATRRPANPVGWLLVGTALAEAVCGAGREYLVYGLLGGTAPGWLWAGWFADSCYLPSIVSLPVLLTLFPDGRPPSPRLRWLVPATVTAGAVTWLSYLFAVDVTLVRGRRLPNPAAHLAPQDLVVAAEHLGLVGVALGLLGGVVALVVRYRAAQGAARQQVKWVVWAGVLLGVEVATELIPGNPVSSVTGTAAVALFAAAVAVAILRHRLLDIDVVINRTVVFVVLSAAVVGTYMACVTAFAAAVGQPVRLGGGLLATALVAVGFVPARQRVQRVVDRMMYGERRDPYGVMSRLGASLEPRGSRSELAVVVDTVTQTLKLPYAAIVAPGGEVLAATGVARGTAVAWPLVYQGACLGELRVEPRPPAGGFGRDERRLLVDLARQVAVAVHAVQLSADLRASRRRLVTAKEEERRRLRRDLHDGLGPKLAAVGLQLDTARMLLGDRPEQAAETLTAVTAEIRATIDDVRRLVYELRPPALDELGLVGAVRDCAARLEPGGPLIEVAAAHPLPPLPAAVEVAAYRIANEALTNVVRHADAGRCEVGIRVDGDELVVTVRDDGTGLPAAGARSGVGMQSMAERAAEIGGCFLVGPGTGGHGALATARLPLGRGHD